MKSKYVTLILLIISILFIICANTSTVNADNGTGGSQVAIRGGSSPVSQSIWGDALSLAPAGNIIVGAIRWVGIAILVGAIIVKGIRFVTSSPDGKAEIKKEIVMLTFGGVLLFGLTTILGMIIDIVQSSNLN